VQPVKSGPKPYELLAQYVEARAVALLDEFELIDEQTDEARLDRFCVRLRRDVSREARDLLEVGKRPIRTRRDG
jgi:hypothetical protein